jgi:hypothetical protein
MNQNPEQAAVEDILQSSELSARLLRRLTEVPGIMDTAMLRQVLERLSRSVKHPPTLFDDLMARYRLDDGSSAGIDPLIMEQSWIMNISAYLTNENSFSSTVNQYIAAATASKAIEATGTSSPSGADMSRELPSTIVATRVKTPDPIPHATSSDARYPDERTKLSEEAAPLSSTGSFRVSRNPPRRAWDAGPAYGPNVVSGQVLSSERTSTATAPDEPSVQTEIHRKLQGEGGSDSQQNLTTYAIQGEQPPSTRKLATKEPFEFSMPGSANASAVAVKGNLPLARAQFAGADNQRTFSDEGRVVLPQLSRAYPISEKRRPAHVEPLDISAGASFGPGGPSAEIEISTKTFAENLPLVRKHVVSSQTQRQPPNLVWRKGADPSSIINPGFSASGVSYIHPANQAAGSTSTIQSPHGNTIMPESSSRRDELRAGSAVPTERILRNISRKLLIERERRGY